MAWVLKMDEVIESGLVHDFDASLTGIGQELGAGAYSMRYGRHGPAGRAGVRADARLRTLGEGWQDPGPPPGGGCDRRCPGPPRLGVRACRVAAGAVRPSQGLLPVPVAGLGEGGPATLGPGTAEGLTLFAVRTLRWLVLCLGKGVSSPRKGFYGLQ